MNLYTEFGVRSVSVRPANPLEVVERTHGLPKMVTAISERRLCPSPSRRGVGRLRNHHIHQESIISDHPASLSEHGCVAASRIAFRLDSVSQAMYLRREGASSCPQTMYSDE